jgi:esterase/lipase superfamily enzyme
MWRVRRRCRAAAAAAVVLVVSLVLSACVTPPRIEESSAGKPKRVTAHRVLHEVKPVPVSERRPAHASKAARSRLRHHARSRPAPRAGEAFPTAPDLDPHNVGLFVASTRKVRPDGRVIRVTDERSDQLAFGRTWVHIPEDHKAGQVERPLQISIFGISLYRQTENDKQHFVIKSTSWLSRDEFVRTITASGGDQALVFVHGFNTTFDEGAYRLAQIVWDTQFKGIPILFSWPSRGGLRNYLYDRESAMFSVGGFVELLRLLQDNPQLTAIHVIAHSMGNQIVVNALANPGIALKPLGEVVLAAPDVDRDVFRSLAARVAAAARGVTLYASSVDRALAASRELANFPRAGDVLPAPDGPVVVPGMQTIDVTAVGNELFGLNHNTFAAQRALIDDIGRLLLRGERPPSLRSPVIRAFPEGQDPPLYWMYPR